MTTDTIYEFRDYTLRPGQRDVLIDLFEAKFIEPQEALGAHVRATFRDLDNPDRFVWIRSFENGAARFAALDGFYTAPVWRAHRDAANAAIIDSDNVMLLRPVSGEIGASPQASVGAGALPQTTIFATTYFPAPEAEADFIARFTRQIAPSLGAAAPFATFVTDRTPNLYPRLPVRENETAFVTLARSPSSNISADLAPMFIAPMETRRLQPTARSSLR